MNQRMVQNMDKKVSPRLNPIKEETSAQKNEQPAKPQVQKEQLSAKNVQEVTGNSFFNDVTLNMEKRDANHKPSLGNLKTNMIKKQAPQTMAQIPEERPETKVQGFNVYQMEQAKPNLNAQPEDMPRVQKQPQAPMDPSPIQAPVEASEVNDSMLGNTKIRRENVKKDLNCTINDESIIEYYVDDDGYLLTEKGQLIYDDNGKVVKLTEDEIKKFKENELYEEVEC